MELNHLCMGCMEDRGNNQICPVCGWVEGTPPESPVHMPARTLLNEKYLLGRVLGQGGFGITYLAWDIYLDRKLAIKEYFPRELVFRDPDSSTVAIYQGTQAEQYSYGLSKFLAEAKNLARFEGHPNIVSVRDYFEANDTAYMVMNYLEGVTFADYLKRRDSGLPFNEVLSIIMPVLDALRYVHEAGLLHRDISPDNIMITIKRRVMLLDFGAARHALGEKGRKYSVIVKPGYAPEEQYRSNGIQGPWTDIYAVAATFYRALTNRMPPESLDRLSDDILVPPSDYGVSIPPDQEKALLKAMAVRAGDRYQSVGEFQNNLIPMEERIDAGEDLIEQPYYPEPDVKTKRDITTGFEEYEDPVSLGSVEAPPEREAGDIPVESAKIGRAVDNDLVINDSMVSRHHAAIEYRAGSWYIRDLGSTHGTTVNGAPVNEEMELPPEALIQLSHYTIYLKNNTLIDANGNVLLDLYYRSTYPGRQHTQAISSQVQDTPNYQASTKKLLFLAGSALVGIFIIVYLVLLIFF